MPTTWIDLQCVVCGVTFSRPHDMKRKTCGDRCWVMLQAVKMGRWSHPASSEGLRPQSDRDRDRRTLLRDRREADGARGTAAMKQQLVDVMRFVADYTDDHGHAPTFREIQHALNWPSVSMAHYWIARLLERGIIAQCEKCPPESTRMLRLTPYGRRVLAEEAVAV